MVQLDVLGLDPAPLRAKAIAEVFENRAKDILLKAAPLADSEEDASIAAAAILLILANEHLETAKLFRELEPPMCGPEGCT